MLWILRSILPAHSGAVRVEQRASQRPAAARCAALRLLQHGASWSVVMNIYAQAELSVGI